VPLRYADRERLAKINAELDQCWDLLRQRRALRDAGQDPDQAEVRSANVVERYLQQVPVQRLRLEPPRYHTMLIEEMAARFP
jgi:hypothetical protein